MQGCPNCQGRSLVTLVKAHQTVNIAEMDGTYKLESFGLDFIQEAVFDEANRPLVKCPDCVTVWGLDPDDGLIEKEMDELPDIIKAVATENRSSAET